VTRVAVPSWSARGPGAWRVAEPDRPGHDQIIAAAAEGQLSALVVAGVDPADLSDVRLAERAIDEVGFLVSFELRNTSVAQRADVVFRSLRWSRRPAPS